MTNKLERLMEELQAEAENQREERREKAAEWFGRVLDESYNGQRQAVRGLLLEGLKRKHGLEESGYAGEGEAGGNDAA